MRKPQWEKLVSRSEDMLHWDSCISIRREGVRLGKIYWQTKSDLVIKKDGSRLGDFYVDASRNGDEPLSNLNAYTKEINTDLDAALEEGIRIVESDLTLQPGSDREQARELYIRFRLNMGLMVFGFICTLLLQKPLKTSLGEERWEDIEKQVLMPYKRTLLAREYEEIAEIQESLKEHPHEWLVEKAKELAEKYGFIHSEYISESWTEKDYIDALQGPHMPVAETRLLQKELFSDYEWWLIESIGKMVYIYDEGKMSLVRANWALRQTFTNLGLDERLLLRLTEPEFFAWTEKGVLPPEEILRQREANFAILSLDNEYNYYSGEAEVRSLMREQGILSEEPVKDLTEFKGMIASPGLVQGRVRILTTQEESKNLLDGEILVASMTTPEYINAMRRSAAFITDEGGTICHAAIVSREFKKPCIVGTKVATKVLRNSDLVEVDANKGVVRILARADQS